MGSRKLVVSHAGSQGVFGLVEQDLLKQLISHQTDLAYGHKSYRVNIDIVSHPFEIAITKMNDDLNKQPMLHIFWTDAETEAYRNHVKEQLSLWFDRLQQYNTNNYLIIHATFQDKAAILHKFSVTKTSMSERIRNDFGSQRADKTIMFKAESNSTASSQSWLIAVGKIRESIIKSVTLKLAAMDKSVNQVRDTHGEEDFDLYKYMEAKEQLCLLYELTGLYEEAYRSSEEVLSLFRQYVSNLRQCQIAPWIEEFIEREITNWSGLSLHEDFSVSDIAPQQLNSIQLCCVIFRRIAHQLTALHNPRDLAKKGLNFLLQTVQECKLLKSKYPKGALVVWVYVGCIELLEAVKKSSPLNNMDVPEPLAVAKGQLYNLAREKLYKLGTLVGHVQSEKTLTKEQIELLIAGSKRGPSRSSSTGHRPSFPPPDSNITSDLQKILTDKSFFHKQYIDLCQLSIVSCKQGSWTHHAQFIMMRQALYLRHRGIETECLNAETHLRDVCHAYYTQGWHKLAAYSRVKLCDTQRHLGLLDRELATCCHLSTEQEHITQTDRQTYSKRLMECVEKFNEEKLEDQILIPFNPLFQYEILGVDNEESCILLVEDTIRVKNKIQITIQVQNYCTEPVANAVVSLKLDTGKDTLDRSRSQVSDVNDFSMVPIESTSDLDDGLYGISLKAESELMNDDSERSETKHTMVMASDPLTLVPGSNTLFLTVIPSNPGLYGVSSLQVQVGCVVFRLKCPAVPSWLETVQVENEASSVSVKVVQPKAGVWISGKQQYCTLAISTDKAFHSLSINLRTPTPGLNLTPVENGTYSVEGEEEQGLFTLGQTGDSWTLTLPALLSKKLIHLPLPMICEPGEEDFCQHLLDVSWEGGSISLLLTFHLPFEMEITYRFQGDVLYLISGITSALPTDLILTGCQLDDPGSLESIVEFKERKLIPKQKFCYIWRMSKSAGLFPKGAHVKLDYTLPGSNDSYTFYTPVTVAPKDPHFSVSLSCLTDEPREGETCEFEVRIEAQKPVASPQQSEDRKIWRLLYGITSQRGEWSVCGYKRRQIDIVDKLSFKVELLALTSGKLEYPQVHLWEYKDAQLQATGNSRDLLYITSDEPAISPGELTSLSARESDPLMVRSPTTRKRSATSMPRVERVDYSGGKERVKVVSSIVLNTLTGDSIAEIPPQRMCQYNALSLVAVNSA